MKRAENRQTSDSTPGHSDWVTFPKFTLFLGLLVVLSFSQILLGLETFVTRDFGHFAYPLAFYQRECFWRGTVPLWNPYNDCGLPFLAQWNPMPLYPPSLIYLFFPLGWSLSFFCLLHLWFGGLGMYWLALRWTDNRLAAALAGLVFAFNGLALNSLMWPSNMATLSWMPWVLGLVERAWREGNRWILYAGLAAAMQVLAGGPETIGFTWLIVFAIWAPDVWRRNSFRHQRGSAGKPAPQTLPKSAQSNTANFDPLPFSRLLLRLSGVVLIMLALSAAQLLPTFDLIAHSQREKGYGDVNWALPLRGWVNFLVPVAFARRWMEGVFFQSGQGWVSSFYLGSFTLALGALGLRYRRGKTWALLVLSLGAYVCALGANTPILPSLRHIIPLLSLMRFPVKFVIIIVFTIPVLAAFGVAQLLSGEAGTLRARQKRLLVSGSVLLALIGLVLLWSWMAPEMSGNSSDTLINGLVRAAFLVGATVLFLALLRDSLPYIRGAVLLLLLLILWLDLWTHAPVATFTVPPAVYAPAIVRDSLKLNPEPKLGASRVMISPFADEALNRLPGKDVQQGLLARRLGYFSDLNLLDETPKVDGFFPLYPREIEKVVSLLYASTNASFPQLEQFLAVSHVTTPGEFTDWQARKQFSPIITGGQSPIFLDDDTTLRRLFDPQFDSRKVVFLPPEYEGLVTAKAATETTITPRRFDPQEIEFTVQAAAPTLVVIAQSHYHCWRASVDDQSQPLLRANFAFQAVQVSAGMHQVRLIYTDRAFQAGAAISLLTLCGCLGATAWFWRKRMV